MLKFCLSVVETTPNLVEKSSFDIHYKKECAIFYLLSFINIFFFSWLFKLFKFGNGNRMSYENLVILEFKYLQNKKWLKQAVKSARIKKSYITHYFYFTQITNKNSQFSFTIYHVFTTFVKLCGCRFLYFFSLCDVRNEADFLLLEHSSSRGLNRKNT